MILKVFLLILSLLTISCEKAYASIDGLPVLRERLEPYLLPEDHPIKHKLDHLLADPEVLNSEESLKKAGFDLSKSQRQANHVKVAKHRKLKHYLLKAYTNDQLVEDESSAFVRRVTRAQIIQEAIDRLGYHADFKVPRKWIYLLPHATFSCEQRQCVLVVEDMHVFEDEMNAFLWKNPQWVTQEKLLALYTLLSEEGLVGSIYLDNIPFSLDGKIALIDTEHVYVWPVPYNRLTRHLPKELRAYWKELTTGN
jgi:hypothetical protein